MSETSEPKQINQTSNAVERNWLIVFSFGASLMILSIAYLAYLSLASGPEVAGVFYSVLPTILAVALIILLSRYRKSKKVASAFSNISQST